MSIQNSMNRASTSKGIDDDGRFGTQNTLEGIQRFEKKITRVDDKDRDNMITLLTKVLLIDSDHSLAITNHATTVATAIIDACQSIPKLKYQHRNTIRNIAMVLKRDPRIRTDVLYGRKTPDDLARTHMSEFASDRQRFDIAGYQEEGFRASMRRDEEVSAGSDIKCQRCGKRNVTYKQAQTRSADEPMTTFYYCTDCGARWKQ